MDLIEDSIRLCLCFGTVPTAIAAEADTTAIVAEVDPIAVAEIVPVVSSGKTAAAMLAVDTFTAAMLAAVVATAAAAVVATIAAVVATAAAVDSLMNILTDFLALETMISVSCQSYLLQEMRIETSTVIYRNRQSEPWMTHSTH